MTSAQSRAARLILQAGGIGVAVLLVYVAGACPTIYVGDSGELVTAVEVLGIPHPTGYPLYVLLGKLWTNLLPFGPIAWRMSLFSAFAGAAACALLYLLARSAGLSPLAGAVAALSLAFSGSFWSEANIQRVYTLGAVFVVLATMAVFGWHARRRTPMLCLAFFLCGLGACNHTFMAVYAVVLAGWAVTIERDRLLRPGAIIALATAFGVGLLPYVYLPLRSAQNPPLDWGNPETLRALLAVVLRLDFWDRSWVEGPIDLAIVAWDYVRSFADELSPAGAVLVVAGIAAALWRPWPATFLLLVMAANVAIVALHGSRADIFIWHRYYIPSYVVAALFAGAAVEAAFTVLPRRMRWAALVLPLWLLVSGWRSHDRSRYEIADAYARTVLLAVPPGAHLAASDDSILFSLIYLTMVEKQRPDVHLIMQGVGAADLAPLHFDAEGERLFFTHHPNWNLPGLEIVPVGLVFEARRPGTMPPYPVIPRDILPGEEDPLVPKDYLTQNLIGDFHYMLGFSLLNHDRQRALRELQRAAASAPNNATLFYNLGLLYQRAGLPDQALAAFRRSHHIEPRHLPSRSRPRAADRIAELMSKPR
jgi:tetratricopeptide (TPR) repeat protein